MQGNYYLIIFEKLNIKVKTINIKYCASLNYSCFFSLYISVYISVQK